MCNFLVNGYNYQTESTITILDLINYFDYNTTLLILEYNSQICHRKNWDNIIVRENDKIEMITIVGGG